MPDVHDVIKAKFNDEPLIHAVCDKYLSFCEKKFVMHKFMVEITETLQRRPEGARSQNCL